MRLGANKTERIQQAAGAWAHAAGFASVAAVPIGKAGELVSAVVASTKLTVAEVRAVLIDGSAGVTERAARDWRELRGGAGAAAPITSGGQSPLATQIAALQGPPEAAAPAPWQLSDLNAVFAKTADDIAATRVVITRRATPKTLNELTEACSKLLLLLDAIDGGREDQQSKQEIVRLYKNLLSDSARDKGVFLVKSTPEQPVHSFRLENRAPAILPDTPRVQADELGRGSSLAVDAASGRSFVLDYRGEVIEVATLGELVLRRREKLELEKGAEVLAADPRALEQLRAYSDNDLSHMHGNSEHVSLLEDAKSDLTRVYATKWVRDDSLIARRLVVEGPFRGIFLDDVVNELAVRRGRGERLDIGRGALPTTPKNGEPMVTATTVQERGEMRRKLLIRVPDNRAWTEARRSLRRLSELEPSVKYRQGSGNTTFIFGPEHYKLVRDIAGGLVLAGDATALLTDYFDALTRVELASSDDVLPRHMAGAIGGFKERVPGPDGKAQTFELTYWQQKSLAWLEARGHRGVIALDTGMGKTLVAIGMMQELQKRQAEKRPFLVVTPPGLTGNLPAEVRRFCTPEVAEALLANLVTMDYSAFARASRTGKHEGARFRAADFGAVFFDEAQWVKNRRSVGGAAALAFDHPRKVVLTKSVMKDSIDDVFTLACIANNVDLNDAKAGKESRYLMRKFRTLYTHVVGGRTVGVREEIELATGKLIDPKHPMHTFIKSSFLHADKRIDDRRLPRLRQSSVTLTMTPKMEKEYRKRARTIARVMRGMVSLYRDQGVSREYIDDRGRTRREIDPKARDKRISKMFGVELRGAIHALNDLTNVPAKLDHAAEIIWKHLDDNPRSRAVLFSDSASYVVDSARRLSEKIPGKLHVAALAKEMLFFQDGKEVKELRLAPNEAGWHVRALEKIGENGEIASTTLFGPIYQQGQNLQWANVGIHLDRDTWSRQNTEQREGRLWRRGQSQRVSFYNLDWVYPFPKDELDRTLDEVRALYEKVEGQLFHDVIVVPQAMELGEEWAGIRGRDELRLDTRILELALAPSIEQAALGGFP